MSNANALNYVSAKVGGQGYAIVMRMLRKYEGIVTGKLWRGLWFMVYGLWFLVSGSERSKITIGVYHSLLSPSPGSCASALRR